MDEESAKSGEAEKEIKTMKLYSQVDRIYNELKEIGFDRDSKLDVDDVSKFDQYHYHGTAAIDHAIKVLSIGEGETVLDVGSGLGGPARYLASRCHCHVVSVELQQDLHQTALDLTKRCGLADNVRHVHANFLTDNIGCESVDVLVSWLVFLHITEKKQLFERCKAALKPGGKMYIEDFFIDRTPSAEGAKLLNKLYLFLDTKEKYLKDLTDAGFTNMKFDDVSVEWTAHVSERAEQFRAAQDRHRRVHGDDVYVDQQDFYDNIKQLFTSGDVKGCIVVAEDII